ncbi:MAG: hypothetical protein NTV94_16830 [Planctomycetota bacterium]|nr:hypothetical protein [Planctomycetota bacterium]
MATDPIRPARSTQHASEIAGASDVSRVGGAAGGFRVQGASGAGGVQTTHFAALRTRIQDGLARNLTRDAILDDLVAFETNRAFGAGASQAVRAKVAEQFRTDPVLSALFADLFAAAVGKPAT